jgi:hypothetical protein
MNRKFLMMVGAAALLSSAGYAQELLPAMSGGIGKVEREAIEAQQANYKLKLVFTGQGGMYLSRVSVVMTNKAGEEVLNTVAKGPYLLVDLAPGRYHVEATAEGNTKKFVVSIGSHLQTQHVVFPITDGSDSE